MVEILPSVNGGWMYLYVQVEGKGNGIKTVIANMSEIAKALSRPPTCMSAITSDIRLDFFAGNVCTLRMLIPEN